MPRHFAPPANTNKVFFENIIETLLLQPTAKQNYANFYNALPQPISPANILILQATVALTTHFQYQGFSCFVVQDNPLMLRICRGDKKINLTAINELLVQATQNNHILDIHNQPNPLTDDLTELFCFLVAYFDNVQVYATRPVH